MYEAIDRYVYSLIERSSPDFTIWNVEKARQGKPVNAQDTCQRQAERLASERKKAARQFRKVVLRPRPSEEDK